jgi:hypothetical protein
MFINHYDGAIKVTLDHLVQVRVLTGQLALFGIAIRQHVAVGMMVIALSLFVIAKERFILEKTHKGQRLVSWFGNDRALWVLRTLALLAILFGALLAAEIIRPIKW